MNAVEILSHCRNSDIALAVDAEGKLHVSGNKDGIATLREDIKAHKAELVAILQAPVTLDLTREDHGQAVLPESARTRRFKVTLKSGGVLLHSAPSGLTRREAIELSKDWGEVSECVPVFAPLEVSKSVPLDLTLAAATAGLPITAEQFRSFLSQEDLADIAAGLIPVECLRAYAERFSRRLAPTAAADARVRCGDCRHFDRIDRPHIGRCAKGHGRYWLWDTDPRQCEDFEAAVEGQS